METSHSWFRSHPAEFGSIHYGRARRFRFDDPDGEYGVLYIAEDPFGAFVETFGQLMSTPAKLPRAISSGELSSKAVSEIVCSRTLRLADLTACRGSEPTPGSSREETTVARAHGPGLCATIRRGWTASSTGRGTIRSGAPPRFFGRRSSGSTCHDPLGCRGAAN